MSGLLVAQVQGAEPIHLINFPEYHATHSQRPRNFEQFCEMVCASKDPKFTGKIKGIWQWEQWDPKTGEVKKREWNCNVVTDNGAINILASAIANASNANPWNNIYINNNSGSTTLSSTLSTGTPIATGASLGVAALPAAVPLNYPAPANANVTTLQINYGGASPQTISMNALTAQNATLLNVVGFTPSSNWAAGTPVVPVPNVQENPTNANLKANQTTVVEMYSGVIAAGGFTYTPTTGAGNRSVVVTFVFKNVTNGGSTPNGAYTDAWLVNVTSAASNATSGNFVGNYVCHEINTPMTVNNSNNVTVTITIKI